MLENWSTDASVQEEGSSTDAKNYRVITILPILTKIPEAVLKELWRVLRTPYNEGSHRDHHP